jgi:hypothetical protein
LHAQIRVYQPNITPLYLFTPYNNTPCTLHVGYFTVRNSVHRQYEQLFGTFSHAMQRKKTRKKGKKKKEKSKGKRALGSGYPLLHDNVASQTLSAIKPISTTFSLSTATGGTAPTA